MSCLCCGFGNQDQEDENVRNAGERRDDGLFMIENDADVIEKKRKEIEANRSFMDRCNCCFKKPDDYEIADKEEKNLNEDVKEFLKTCLKRNGIFCAEISQRNLSDTGTSNSLFFI